MLHVPVGSNAFGLVQPSTTARPRNTTQGTSVTPNTGSKGSWAQMIDATTGDSYGILICVTNNFLSAASRNSVVDIGIDETGGTAYQVKIPDLICGNAGAYNTGGIWYYFPVYIPAGSRVAVRSRSSVTTAFTVYCQLFQRAYNPSQVRKASFVEAYGIGTTAGVTITPGTTNDGAWTLIGTTVNRVWWWQFGVQLGTGDTSHTTAALHVDIAVGDATTKDIVILDAQVVTNLNEYALNPPLSAGVEFPVPAGVNVYARVQSSTTTDTTNIAVYAAGG
jgi:hypothetical protein